MSTDQQKAALDQIAHVARLLRDGIKNALPVSGDQYLTISIPGTVIDTRDIADGGSYVWSPAKTGSPIVPTAVQQAEANLVDGIMPLATVMLGNTGMSVSRSYMRALDVLVARRADGAPGAASDPEDPNYLLAMNYLRTPDSKGKTPIDYYVEKQAAWAKAQAEWDEAKQAALDRAKALYPNQLAKIEQEWNDWNQQNFRKFKTNVQGKWMDWVVNGLKYTVEKSFGVVDIESIMARIEDSKESWRDSTIVDADGVNEVQTVELTPKPWAQYCQDKVNRWVSDNGTFSREQLVAEIDRLTQLELSLEALKISFETDKKFPLDSSIQIPAIDPDRNKARQNLQGAYKDLYEAQGKLAAEQKVPDNATAIDAALTQIKDKQGALQMAQEVYNKAAADEDKFAMQNPGAGASHDQAQAWIDKQIASVKANLDKLSKMLESDRFVTRTTMPIIAGAAPDATAQQKDKENPIRTTDLANPSDLQPDPDFVDTSAAASAEAAGGGSSSSAAPQGSSAGAASDPWTTISVSYSATSYQQTVDSSSWGMSVSGGASFGLFSIGGAYSHDESKQDMYADMARCDVNITFSAMVVNIRRPWLYGELFRDTEIDASTGSNLSPGPDRVHTLLQDVRENANEIGKFSIFPSYPTAFVLAANTVIEFTGTTSHIEKHFSQHSNSGSVSVGYGPFSMTGSFHESAQHQNVQMQATATGCKIMFGSPQIIAWVSQILPELPRGKGFNPLVTNFI